MVGKPAHTHSSWAEFGLLQPCCLCQWLSQQPTGLVSSTQAPRTRIPRLQLDCLPHRMRVLQWPTVRSLNHFEFIFVDGMRKLLALICLFYIWLSSFPSTTFWRNSFLHCIFWLVCHRLIDFMFGGLYLKSILVHWPICLFLCQHHAVLITVVLLSVVWEGYNSSFSSFFWRHCDNLRSSVVPCEF